MVTLTNPITPSNIKDRFGEVFIDTINATIVWGTDNKPFTEMPDSNYGGPVSGKTYTTEGISASNFGTAGNTITASGLTAKGGSGILPSIVIFMSAIQQQRAILNVTGSGGNTGSRPTAGVIFDQTQIAHLDDNHKETGWTLNAGYGLSGTTANRGNPDSLVSAGLSISATNLETYFTNLKNVYDDLNVVSTDQVDVCHASCHSSCHGSRGRR